jgi:ketosteroid isomerase-like protein
MSETTETTETAERETTETAEREAAGTAEREIRDLFARWFDEAAAKDIDAVMAHVAPDVRSYEHEAPLQYVGADGLRRTCQTGFDLMPGDFRWDIPDLQVLVRDDVAVTWGLNRMRAQEPGGEPFEGWSRGTRVFQRIDGRWLMIHQHVSYPYHPQTGEAATDLRP